VRDPYEVLGISREATDADLKSAFRKLAMKHHPDRNPNDPSAAETFKEINQAYQILSDPQKRAAYDRYGAAAFQAGGGGAGPGFVDLGGFDSLFDDLLGAFGFRTAERGGDVQVQVRLTFEEAALGCDKELSYECLDVCERCKGTTAEPGSPVSSCRTCGGHGRVRIQQGLLPLVVERPCPQCGGAGKSVSQPCRDCHGRGVTKRRRTVEVGIPAGIEPGASRVIPGGGSRLHPARPPGDLEVVVDVKPHELFQRVNDDIACRVPIGFVTAALGGEVEIPTLDGRSTVKVPPATQPGSVLRIRGAGIAHRGRSGRGDLLVEIAVEVPTKLSPKAKELIEQLGAELGEDVGPEQRSFVEKLRSLFG